MNLDIPGAQGCGDLEPNEARSDHDSALCPVGRCDDRAAIVERAQQMNVRLVGAGDRQPHGLRTGRQQQAIEGNGLAAGKQYFLGLAVDRCDFGAESQIDPRLSIEIGRPQRQP